MQVHAPSQLGDLVGNVIEELELTVTDAAKRLGVSRQALNNLINNPSAPVSPEMALRLEAAFGSTVDSRLCGCRRPMMP
jgi:addiction module HigA family antidote